MDVADAGQVRYGPTPTMGPPLQWRPPESHAIALQTGACAVETRAPSGTLWDAERTMAVLIWARGHADRFREPFLESMMPGLA
eukprot:3583533-Rhodomonas_salina.1